MALAAARGLGMRVAAFDTSVEMWGPLMWMTAAHRLLPKLLAGSDLALVRMNDEEPTLEDVFVGLVGGAA